jgi:hypothetical protein
VQPIFQEAAYSIYFIKSNIERHRAALAAGHFIWIAFKTLSIWEFVFELKIFEIDRRRFCHYLTGINYGMAA